MTELSPHARLLLDRAREAAMPAGADRVRVRAQLRARLTPGSPPSSAAPALAKAALVAVVAGAAVLAALLGSRSEPDPRRLASARVPASAAPTEERASPVPAAPPARSPAAASSAASTVPGPVRPARPRRAAPSGVVRPRSTAPTESVAAAPPPPAPPAPAPATAASIAEELRVVSGAQSALRRDPVASLRLTDEWAARFPGGALHEEALAVRILSLCALGRAAEARALATGLFARFPGTTYAPRIHAACGPR
jgi:hypothetical protein